MSKIKELAERHFSFRYKSAPKELNPGHTIVNLEEFAKDIIEECIDHVNWVGNINKNPVEPIHTSRAIVMRIKQKFGVK